MDKTIILKQNSEEIRERIERSGIGVCHCASYKDSIWLDYSTKAGCQVHGVGYANEDARIQDEVLQFYLHELKNPVWCDDVETFIKEIKETLSNKLSCAKQ